jgi:hypothetical protein
MPLFTEEERHDTLEALLGALRQDERLAGVILVGSAAEGFDDRFSDIDLTVVVADQYPVADIFSAWITRIAGLFPVVSSFEVNYAENMFLGGFLLDNFLELDIGFLSLRDLFAKRSRWQVAFDRSDQIEGIMRASWEKRSETGLEIEYRRLLDSIWHYISHVTISVARGHTWRALHYLEIVRTRAVEMACIGRGLDPHHFRPVHQLPSEFLDGLQETLLVDTSDEKIYRALEKAAALFFAECHAIDQILAKDLSTELHTRMKTYLKIFLEQSSPG